jgi:hypothetical protein
VTGAGPYAFSFSPQDKPDLESFQVLAYLSPTGNWADNTVAARFTIPKAVTSSPVAPTPVRDVQVGTSNFLIEAYFRTEPRRTRGVLIEKVAEAGYSLTINAAGGVTFAVRGTNAGAVLDSVAQVNDGNWHHVIAEANRPGETLTLYVDGRPDATGPGIGPDVSLACDADLHVGGTPCGRYLSGALDFLRISLGTLADAKTSIEELYAWQFDGPFLRDFAGNEPAGLRRDAGALESRE